MLTLDVDTLGLTAAEGQDKVIADIPGLKIELLEQEAGHGFGLAEIVTISVTIGAGVTSELAAAYIRDGIKAVIRRVRGSKGEADGTHESITTLIEREREDDTNE
jgi:hypothetical protein